MTYSIRIMFQHQIVLGLNFDSDGIWVNDKTGNATELEYINDFIDSRESQFFVKAIFAPEFIKRGRYWVAAVTNTCSYDAVLAGIYCSDKSKFRVHFFIG